MELPWTLVSHSEAETEQIGEELFRFFPLPSIVVLEGTLGAGKTRLVQAIAKAGKVPPEEVSSPTYVLIHEYCGAVPIFHFDVYRLRSEDEFLQLGPEEYFDRPGLSFIEWGNRVESLLPPDYFIIQIEVLGESTRKFTVRKSCTTH